MKSFFLALTSVCMILPVMPAHADVILDYRINNEQSPHQVMVAHGFVLIPGVAEGGRSDLLYLPPQQSAMLINHRKKQYMIINQKRLEQLASQAEIAQPILKGLSSQIKQLDPKQQEKWNNMLGGIDFSDTDSYLSGHYELKRKGQAAMALGGQCDEYDVVEGGGKTAAQICLASQQALRLEPIDYKALRDLLDFTAELHSSMHGLAQKFLGGLPGIRIEGHDGIPANIRQLQGESRQSLTLKSVRHETLDIARFTVPQGYQEKHFKIW
ncbi:MAG: hypothetical protein RIQ52_1673 [Pseudomonadota bacterium]